MQAFIPGAVGPRPLHQLMPQSAPMRHHHLVSLLDFSFQRRPLDNISPENAPGARGSGLLCRAIPPLQSWGGEAPDWDAEPSASDDELEDALEAEILGPEGGGGPEFAFQNALASVLLAALALSVGNVLLKLGVVAFALVSTAFRYTAVGFLVLFLLALFS